MTVRLVIHLVVRLHLLDLDSLLLSYFVDKSESAPHNMAIEQVTYDSLNIVVDYTLINLLKRTVNISTRFFCRLIKTMRFIAPYIPLIKPLLRTWPIWSKKP